MLMTADSLRKTQYGGGTIIFLSFFFISLPEARRGSDAGEKCAETEMRGRMCGGEKKGGKRSGGNGRSPGSSRFPYALTVRGRQLVLEKERGREGVRMFRGRITASSDVYLGPDYLWLRLSRTAFERFIECLACAGHANSEPYVYSIWGWGGEGDSEMAGRSIILFPPTCVLLRRVFALSLIRPVRSNYSPAKQPQSRPLCLSFRLPLPLHLLAQVSFYPSAVIFHRLMIIVNFPS